MAAATGMKGVAGAQGDATVRSIAVILDAFVFAHAGTETQLLALIRGLDRTRIQPRIFVLRPPSVLAEALPGDFVEVLGIGRLLSARSLLRMFGLCIRLRRAGVRLAHLYFNDTSVALPWLLRLCGIRVIVSRRDLGFWYTPAILRVLRINRPAVTAVIANSAAVREMVAAKEGFPADRIRVIENGKSTPVLPTKEAARDLLVLPAKAFVVAVVANVRPIKRIADVVRAVAQLKSRIPEIRLLVAGADAPGSDGPSHIAELRLLAEQLQVTDHVTFLGAVSAPWHVIAASDVCVLTSESEGMSNAVIEYMLVGRPAICTAVGGNVEIIDDGKTGFLVPVGRPERIAGLLGELAENPDLAHAVGSSAQLSARARFSTQRMVDAHHELYAELLGE